MKKYSAMVKDGQRVVIIRDQDYPNKAEFIHDLRANGYKVNPKKVKPADVFNYICEHTDMNPWDWDLKKVPGEEVTEEASTEKATTMKFKKQPNVAFFSRYVREDGKITITSVDRQINGTWTNVFEVTDENGAVIDVLPHLKDAKAKYESWQRSEAPVEAASQESKSKSSRNATTATFKGRTVKIPKGYRGPDEDGFYMNGHGVQYALVQYGFGEGSVICLETVYSKHVRTIELEEVEEAPKAAAEEAPGSKLNPMCEKCANYPTDCAGTHEHVWTGCVHRETAPGENRTFAPKKLQTMTDDQLLTAWESTEHLEDPQCPTIRGWLMDEIERRYPVDFNAWLDQDAPEDSQLRKYIMAGQ